MEKRISQCLKEITCSWIPVPKFPSTGESEVGGARRQFKFEQSIARESTAVVLGQILSMCFFSPPQHLSRVDNCCRLSLNKHLVGKPNRTPDAWKSVSVTVCCILVYCNFDTRGYFSFGIVLKYFNPEVLNFKRQ